MKILHIFLGGLAPISTPMHDDSQVNLLWGRHTCPTNIAILWPRTPGTVRCSLFHRMSRNRTLCGGLQREPFERDFKILE